MSHHAAYSIGSLTYGIEIELKGLYPRNAADAITDAGVNCIDAGYTHTVMSSWKSVSDGSLSGTGCEIVSPILRGEEQLAELRTVCTALVEAGGRIDRQCGVHVHVGGLPGWTGREFDSRRGLEGLKRIVKLYAKFEDSIDLMLSPSRRGNSCQYACSLMSDIYSGGAPTEKVNQLHAQIDACTTANEINSLIGGRYRKLNVEALWRHGTLEFRAHQGSLDAAKIVNWARFCCALVNAALAMRTVGPRVDKVGQDARFRTKWLFNATIGDDLRRYWQRRIITLNPVTPRPPTPPTPPTPPSGGAPIRSSDMAAPGERPEDLALRLGGCSCDTCRTNREESARQRARATSAASLDTTSPDSAPLADAFENLAESLNVVAAVGADAHGERCACDACLDRNAAREHDRMEESNRGAPGETPLTAEEREREEWIEAEDARGREADRRLMAEYAAEDAAAAAPHHAAREAERRNAR